MSATTQRDHASTLAKDNAQEALAHARRIEDPWYRAQALSWVARFTHGDPNPIAFEAAKAASECIDDYKRSAVRAWEIAALAERGCKAEAVESLKQALALGKCAEPISSRSEALFLLLQAAIRIGQNEAEQVHQVLKSTCPVQEHWRCNRAIRNGGKIILGQLQPRRFFW